ncbi:MAG: FkbM family methyltransferase [Pseudomonadota bacterium]
MSALKAASYAIQRFVLRREYLTAQSSVLGLKFRVKTRDVVGRHIYKYGRHEPAMTGFLLNGLEVGAGDVLIDIGANIGWYSLILDRLAKRHGADVISFEPDPVNFELLQHNLALNGARHTDAVPLALSDAAGTATLHLFSDSNRGRHSILPINSGETVDIPTARLDDYWRERDFGDRVPRLIKVDIEGYELIALRGAAEVLRRCPLLILEYSPGYMRRGGLEPTELLDLVAGHGFTPFRFADGGLAPADLAGLKRSDRQQDIVWRKDV